MRGFRDLNKLTLTLSSSLYVWEDYFTVIGWEEAN